LIAALVLLAAALRAAEARSVSRERDVESALWPAPSYEDYTS
jgi:hypothetical protein